jgi:hypothetical protein
VASNPTACCHPDFAPDGRFLQLCGWPAEAHFDYRRRIDPKTLSAGLIEDHEYLPPELRLPEELYDPVRKR